MKTKHYPNQIDPEVGYARGLFLENSLAEHRKSMRALEIIRQRFGTFGREGIYNFNGIVDNCEVPDILANNRSVTDRYITETMLQNDLEALSLQHLGGAKDFTTLAFNRGSAANITAVLALAGGLTDVIYLVPSRGGHPSVTRGINLAKANTVHVTSIDDMQKALEGDTVTLVTICPLYRNHMDPAVFRKGITLAKARGIPVFVDDAGGARYRVAVLSEAKALDLGADAVMTSTDKEGLDGPRAAIIRGRKDFIDTISMKAAELGTEARPSIMAAIVRALRDFSFSEYRRLTKEYNNRASQIAVEITQYLGESVQYGTHGGDIAIDSESFIEAMMNKAGVDQTNLRPIDVSVVHAMIMLEDFGFMTVASVGKPGSTLDFRVRLNLPDAARISDQEVSTGIINSCERVQALIPHTDAIRKHLFG